MSTRRGPQRLSSATRAAVLAAAALVAAACDPAPTASPTSTSASTPAPSIGPSPEGSQVAAAEVYAQVRRDVESIRGLRPTADVEPVTIDEAQLRSNLVAEFDAETSPEDLLFSERMLIALGLLPAGSSLRDLTLDLQGGQVAGYYSPDRNELFVVSRSGGVGPVEEVTYAHEFTHQLQDQNLDLDGLDLGSANQSDRALAHLALVEGDAVSVQAAWMTMNLTPKEMGQVAAAALDPEGLAALQRAPAFLRETALFPYQSGAFLATGLVASGGYRAVDAAYAAPPDSTEQILHPEKYAARETPKVVKIPTPFDPRLPAGWKAMGQDTLGELILRIWLVQGGVASAQASIAVAGWGGDRLALYESPGGTSVLLVTEWDALPDALEFAAAAKAALPGLGLKGNVVFDERAPTVYIAVGDDADVITPRFFG